MDDTVRDKVDIAKACEMRTKIMDLITACIIEAKVLGSATGGMLDACHDEMESFVDLLSPVRA